MQNKKVTVDIVLPIYNEEDELEVHCLKLHKYIDSLKDYIWGITIADNASTDNTAIIGKKLAQREGINYVRLEKKGRGRAVKKLWLESKADMVLYMDIDLSTDLIHLPSLVNKLVTGADLVIGSRLLPGSEVKNRELKREFISRTYNLMIKLFFQTHFSDAQCGFKGMTKKAVMELIPYIEDNDWFMDTELLVIAEKRGYKIYEEAVRWVDNPGSTVRVLPTAMGDIKGLVRLLQTQPWKLIKIPQR